MQDFLSWPFATTMSVIYSIAYNQAPDEAARGDHSEEQWRVVGHSKKKPTARMMLGTFPSSEMICSLSTASGLPTISLTSVGLYFSTCKPIDLS